MQDDQAMTLFNRIFYFFVKWSFFICLKVYNRISIRWKAPLPERNVIVIVNHSSNLDPVVMGAVFPRRLRYLAKEELFRSLIFGGMIRALGAIPVRKQDSQSAGTALRAFMNLLKDGENVLLFPEGGRSLDGKLQPLEGGAALIALKTGAPVIPVFIAGTFQAMPPGSKWVKPVKISVVLGEAIDTLPFMEEGKGGRDRLLARFEEALVSLEGELSEERTA